MLMGDQLSAAATSAPNGNGNGQQNQPQIPVR